MFTYGKQLEKLDDPEHLSLCYRPGFFLGCHHQLYSRPYAAINPISTRLTAISIEAPTAIASDAHILLENFGSSGLDSEYIIYFIEVSSSVL